MTRITDEILLTALKNGKTISLNEEMLLKELLDGSEGVLYALYPEEEFWKPYHPNVWELSQDSWFIDTKNS